MKSDQWLYEIKPKGKLIDLNLKEIWRYRDLLWMFVKRDIVTVYKQTILGPLCGSAITYLCDFYISV